MKLTSKLLGYLHRVFDKDPGEFLAFRLRYSGTSMTWAVADGVLTTQVEGGPGVNLDVDLSQYTLAELVDHLAAQSGYTIEFADMSALANLSALVLIDGEGDQDTNNGDHLLGYTSLLWSYLEANAVELREAGTQIIEMLRQMEIPTAEAEWIDEHGGYYGIRRGLGETDDYYGPRILVEVLRPRGNNIAIEKAITEITEQDVTVTDVVLFDDDLEPVHDGTISYDGTSTYNAIGNPIYGLFDVVTGYDLEGGPDVAEYSATVAALIETLRDAGTHLRSLSLAGGLMTDAGPPRPADTTVLALDAPFTESDAGPDSELLSVNADTGEFADADQGADSEALNLFVSYNHVYSGLRVHDGAINYAGGLSIPENEFPDVWVPSRLFLQGELGAHYDPSDLSTLFQDVGGFVPVENDGDPVALMLDKSGNGLHASQMTAAAQPVYRTDGTLHWLEADGVDDELKTAVILGQGAQWSAAAAAAPDIAAEAQAVAFSDANSFEDAFGNVLGNTAYVLVASRDADSVEGWLDGVSDGETATTGTPLTPPDGSMTLLAGLPGRFYGGIVLLDRALTDPERQNVEIYLAGLAGVSLTP